MAKFMIDEFRSELITGFGTLDVSQHKSYTFESSSSVAAKVSLFYILP